MKLPGERIDETDYEVIPDYLYSDEHEDHFYTACGGVVTGVFKDLDAFIEAERMLKELSESDHFHAWIKSFDE
jgi:hypothetical protein